MSKKIRLSYIQILIAAVVIGMVAKSMSPQSAEARTESQLCDLIESLVTMRAHIELYRAHHDNNLTPTNSFESFQTAVTTNYARYNPSINKIPANPFNNLNTVRFDGEPAGAGKAGWRRDTKTGKFQADNGTDYAAL